MTINLNVPELKELKPRILVLGIGGAGGNAINGMIEAGLQGVEFVAVNTDAQDLKMSRALAKIQIGTNLTKGLGAGAKHDIGQAAADESLNDIIDYLKGSNMVFITAGMGGGTGTGASHVIARAAKELNILTVGVITLPFSYEGPKRMRRALAGLEELKKHLDTNIIVPNQNLFKIANEKTGFKNSFTLSNEVLKFGVQSVTDLMVRPGLINLDFADVETVMKGMGKAMMGTGEAEGENRAEEATNAALHNPLIDEYSLKGAKGLLVNITGGSDLTLFEVDHAVNKIRAEVDSEGELIFGSIEDQALEGKIRVSIVATALDGQVPETKSVVSMVHRIHNRNIGYGNEFLKSSVISNGLHPTSQTINDNIPNPISQNMTEGAAALDLKVEESSLLQNEQVPESIPEKELSDNQEGIDNISIENATYLQNLEQEANEIKEDMSTFEVDSIEEVTPKLFSDDTNEESATNENKEPELFEKEDGEEDFEIPAFLRRQKN